MTLSLKPADSEVQGKYKAPDGGWGWVIVISSLVIHIIMDGITYSLGTYLTVFTETFGVSHAEASFVHSLLPAVTLACGPLASVLTNKFGCRLTTIIGSLIAFFGFFLSCFVKRFFYLYFTIGIIVGFGFGLIYVPAIVSVGYYFEKKRSLAIGIAVCGSGIGTFILSPINRILVENYSYSGAFLIKSALCLNLCVCGSLMRPVSVEPSEILKRNKRKRLNLAKSSNEPEKINSNENDYSDDDEIDDLISKPKLLLSDEKNENKAVFYQNGHNQSQPHSLFNMNTKKIVTLDRNHSNRTNIGNPSSNNTDIGEMAKSMPMLLENDKVMNLDLNNLEINQAILQLNKSTNSALDILAHVKSLQSIPVTCIEDESSKSSKNDPPENEIQSRRFRKLKQKLLEAIDFTIFKEILFIFFIISNFLTSLGFNVPYIYIVDQATLLKIKPELADLLLSTIGISNSVGRVVLGFLGDLKSVNRIYLYSSVLTICGIATIIEPFCTSFTSFFIYSIVFGFSSGGYVSLTSVLIVDLLGLEKLTDAFGILLVFQGIATSIGPPIVGIIFDNFHSYVFAFVLTGTMIAISGFMCYFIPLIKHYSKKK